MTRLILASNSPRRKELLKDIGYSFEVIPSNINENIDPNNSIQSEIEKLSFNKAMSVFKDNKDAIVIGSDTVVILNNKIYGKPKDNEDAKRILQELRNNTHIVLTAVSIISSKKSETFSVSTEVEFGDITDKEIDKYISEENVLDKAGAYAIQDLAKKFIKSINGDYFTIMGLPVYELYRRLKEYYE